MPTTTELETALSQLKAIVDRLEPSGAFSRTLALERTMIAGRPSQGWRLTMRAADLDESQPGETLVELGSTKGEAHAALLMLFEGATLAISAAAVDVKRKTRGKR